LATDKENPQTQIQTSDLKIISQDIVSEMSTSYINYAMSVIVARALPDVRDGLKPVHRRILYAMYKMGLTPGSGYRKCARIVGEVLGKYHPHGDASVYDALARMAQEFSLRYPLVNGQGNFGSIDGDSPAAMRYTEAKLEKYGAKMLEDIEKSTVNYSDNFDGNEREPDVLPTILPSLLVNGNEGIAVGMATKIPPHNLTEVIDVLQDILKQGNKSGHKHEVIDYNNVIKSSADIANLPSTRYHSFATDVPVSEMVKLMPAPDFPTGGVVYDVKQIQEMYETGRGAVLMRAVAEIEETKSGKFQIVISELPYQVNKARLVAKIAELVRDKKLEGISDLRDESNREGIRIVVELKRDSIPKTVLNKLYKFTEMQKNFNSNFVALVDNKPQILNLKQILEYFIIHRQEVIIRRSEFDLGKAKEREHILEGLMIALNHLDEVIAIIRKSADAEAAKNTLMSTFKLSDIQAQAILDMQLRRLAALERSKIEQEYKEIQAYIGELIKLLSNPGEVLKTIATELSDLKEKYGDKRKTRIIKGKIDEFSEEDLVASENVIVTISEQGYIKRIKDDNYTTQHRGGVGKKAMTTKEDDAVKHVVSCNTHDQMLFFTNRGKVYTLKVYEIPEYSRTAKGVPVINLINVVSGELVSSVLTRGKDGSILDEDIIQEGEVKRENSGKSYKNLLMATRNGLVKKTELTEYDNIRNSGLIAINLDDDDELTWVKPTTGESEVILVTEQGRSIHFRETDVRETGRATRGVTGIRLREGDVVISMDVIRKLEDFMLTISEFGFGKVTVLEQFPIQNRGGSGVFAAKLNSKTGKLVTARIIDHPQLELLLMSAQGQATRIPTNDLPQRNRQTSGVKLMRLKADDRIAAMAII
jgi:DNA gyrase subunit A